LTLALDATYSVGRNLSGVGVYSSELMRGLAVARPDLKFTWSYRPHRFWKGLTGARPANATARLLIDGLSPRSARIFHGLNQRMPRQSFPCSVCTFHDLFVLCAEYSSTEFRARFALQAREAASRADLIICVSNFTASQVESLLGVDRSRLRVIHHGVRFGSPEEAVQRAPLVLHVGAIQKRKNLLMLVEAFERAAPPPWRLCLAGSSGFGAEAVYEKIRLSPARDRIDTPGWLDDLSLARLYASASIFAFPSLDEGFGIPLLEAMAQGVPVIASNRASLPEVCGDAALLLNPGELDAWAGALSNWIGDERERTNFAAAGRRRAAGFSWSDAVNRTLSVYRELDSRL
jgi:glycosyltransferase involved in cell wall biosynthesis